MINIKTNSKLVKNGDIFVALKGNITDGHKYIEEAIKNGAAKIVCEEGKFEVETLVVEDTYKYLTEYLKENYYEYIKKLKLIGITGTNGKTTTSYLIFQALNKLNIKTSCIGTTGFYINDTRIDLVNTTPDILTLYNLLIESVDEGVECVVMEVSSHALSMNRVSGLEFDVGIFSNLTVDHLNYHKTLEAYAMCKKILFTLLRNKKYAIINNDASFNEIMKIENNDNITYGFNKSTYTITDYEITSRSTDFKFLYNNKEYKVKTSLLGKHNIYNMISCIICIHSLGVELEKIIETVNTIHCPKGRMEKVIYNTNTILIDYAHTPDAVLNAINTVKEFSNGKIYSIIGCGGNRDKDKRKTMGFIATDLSDTVIFTNDNPRDEEEEDIVRDMITDVNKNNYEIILNRKEAIKRGIDLLKENDILLILGKGHEEYQIIKDKILHHSDIEEVMNYIKR